jgi:hypothetical protein
MIERAPWAPARAAPCAPGADRQSAATRAGVATVAFSSGAARFTQRDLRPVVSCDPHRRDENPICTARPENPSRLIAHFGILTAEGQGL